MLSKEQFLAHSDLRREEVEIEGLGTVTMRELSLGENLTAKRRHAALLEGVPADEHDNLLSLALVATSLCNGTGPLFAESEIADGARALLAKSQRTVMALQEAFVRLHRGEAALERAVGKSMEIPGGPSFSGSLAISDIHQPGD